MTHLRCLTHFIKHILHHIIKELPHVYGKHTTISDVMVKPATNNDEPDDFIVGPDADLEDVADALADLVGPMSRGEMTRDEVAQLRACASLIMFDLAERGKGVAARNDGTKSQGRVAFGRDNAHEPGLAFFVHAEDISASVAEEYEEWEARNNG